MIRNLIAVATALATVAGTAVAVTAQDPAQGTSIARRVPVRTGVPLSALRATSVIGFAWTATSAGIPDATVQLRNVLSGRVEATEVTSAVGEFVFTDIEGGTYVVELVNDGGRVVALGAPFTAAPGETVATFVRLGMPAPWFTGAFTNTAAAAVSSAASVGIAAVTPPAQNASSDR